MPKSVWRGSLNLGLVNIPVSLYAATEPKDVRFHLVDGAGRRVRYRRFVEVDGEEVERDVPMPPSEGDSSVDSNGPEPMPYRPVRPSSSDHWHPGGANEVEVAYEDLKRGYEVDRERLVTLEPEEIDRARPQPSHTIDLEHFV